MLQFLISLVENKVDLLESVALYSTRKLPVVLWWPMQTKKKKGMCADAGIEGNSTNHSLQATGATVLFDAGVPEVVILIQVHS